MKLLPFPFVRSDRGLMALLLLSLMLAAAGDAVALDVTDTTHTSVGALVWLLSTGELYVTCSGTLVAPDVFLTAGHCTLATRVALPGEFLVDVFVSFDTMITETSPLVGVVELVEHPGFVPIFRNRSDYTHDIGIVRLATPVYDRPTVPLPAEALVDILHTKPGTPVTVVGYGRDSFDQHGNSLKNYPVYAGTRASGHLAYRSQTADWIMLTMLSNQGDDNICSGDSGSPNFLLVDGEEQLVALTSWGNSYSCEEIAWVVRLDTPSAREFLGHYVDLP